MTGRAMVKRRQRLNGTQKKRAESEHLTGGKKMTKHREFELSQILLPVSTALLAGYTLRGFYQGWGTFSVLFILCLLSFFADSLYEKLRLRIFG